jgi:hypothetical protein
MKLLTQEEANKETDVFVGMWRAPYPEIEARFKGITVNYPPSYVVGTKELRDAYLRGDFDEPLYRRVIESAYK